MRQTVGAGVVLELGYKHKPVSAVAAAKVVVAGTDINWQLRWGPDAGPAAEPVAGVEFEAESAGEEGEKKQIPLGSIAVVARGSLSLPLQGRKAMMD